MKKLVVLMAAICFAIISGGNVLADEPSIDTLNRHAVWTNWYDDDGSRLPQNSIATTSGPDVDRQVSIQPMDKFEMKDEVRDFDFIRETKYYDYTEDHGDSA